MCNPPVISPSTSSFDSLSSYSPSTWYGRASIRRGRSLRSLPRSDSSLSYEEEEPHHFLDSCFLCKTPLYLGDDIYMYKGDTPFCSEDCRQDQIEIDEADERKKIRLLAKKMKSRVNDIHVRADDTVFA